MTANSARVCACVGILLVGIVFAQELPARPAPPLISSPLPEQAARPARSRKPKHHSVTLKWTVSTTKGTDGYIVYRAVGGLGAGYDRLTPVPLNATVYRDINVESGKTYVYAVTTVMTINGRVVESEFTPQVVAKVPIP